MDAGLKRSEIESIRKEAKERELTRQRRKDATIKIQAWMRGTWTRKKTLPPLLILYRERLNQRKIKVIARKIKRRWAPFVILKALRKWQDIKAKEKQELYTMFREYSALFIQRCWRGFCVKKLYKQQMSSRLQSRKKIRKLVRSWKIRRILSTRRLQITLKGLKDSVRLISEIRHDQAAILLYNQLQSQLPILKTKLKSDITMLYRSGKWVGLPIYFPDTTNSIIEQEPMEKLQESFVRRDDMPIRPLLVNYEEIQESPKEPEKPQPKKNVQYLKRGAGKMSWKHGLGEKAAEKFENSYMTFQQSEIFEEEPEFRNTAPRDFLKRSSKKVVNQKLKWKAEKRIDCWLSRGSAQYSKEYDLGISIGKSEGNVMHLEQLDQIFLEMSEQYIGINEFLDQTERVGQKIPQLNSNSKFIVEYLEGKQQETVETLESQYNNLCNDELINKIV